MQVKWKPGTQLDLSSHMSALDQIHSLWNGPTILKSQHFYPWTIPIPRKDPASVDDVQYLHIYH